ncbi:MAG: RsmD family RNA methyltransferase [Desulfurococcales archaeon]|nr:RsmD family RNA methyltransferase [Desulfurococcales archaeon]
MPDIVEFRKRCAIVLAPWELAELKLSGKTAGVGEAPAGHGRYIIKYELSDQHLKVALNMEDCRVEETLPLHVLENFSPKRSTYMIRQGGLQPIELRGSSYYKLVPTVKGSYPTLEINGIHMHRVSGTDPLHDTIAKVSAARIRRGDIVLDTCMGLGYTAVHSVRRGATRVLTVEVDDNVIEISRLNPWSWGLEDPRITVVHADVTELIKDFGSGEFTKIIHDPPRITKTTGELYSLEFYKQLYRVMRRGGILFHYTGEPGRKHGANFPGRIAGRLKRVGFHILRYDRRALGLIAIKD